TLLAAMIFLPSMTSFAAQSEISFKGIDPDINDESPVLASLRQRVTRRDFVDKDLTTIQLAKILWAANGTNRTNGKRVIPAAMGVYSVEVYAVTREGIYLYDPDNYKIKLIAEGDFRPTTTTGQSFVSKAAVNLVYVETPDAWQNAKHTPPPRERQIAFANIMVGAMVQNVALAAQAEGLGNCVRGSINRDEFKKVAKLSDEKNILLAQSVGKCN
ncbi:MAG: SagB/ThcOx family dehydrogenase, partial [Selenomonadaceae bacterium]|nr:SagB/ThcOx family dehydrogenase [Selenomonadaceae bacterium]